jgi:rhodanese-related sulfurtransferase
MQPMSVAELKAWLTDASRPAPVVLDVRERWEVARAALPDAMLIPMNEIPARAGELDPDRPLVCLCHHGARSLSVALFLEKQGFEQVYNLTGGIDAWSALIDPTVPRY